MSAARTSAISHLPFRTKRRRERHAGKNLSQFSLLKMRSSQFGEHEMRIAQLILAGSTALMVLSAPALARNSNAPKNDDRSAASPSCHAYEQAADGSWKELPCQEGSASQAQTQHKSAAKTPDEDTR
jgi:hypothetical protein